jgi:hypothetical protein
MMRCLGASQRLSGIFAGEFSAWASCQLGAAGYGAQFAIGYFIAGLLAAALADTPAGARIPHRWRCFSFALPPLLR